MRTLQLYATAAATANAVAQITIASSTILKGVQWTLAADCVADNGLVAVELSKVPTSQIATNGAQDPFFGIRFYNNLATSGMVANGQSGFFRLAVPCRQGEIIYLHCLVTTATFYFNGIFWY